MSNPLIRSLGKVGATLATVAIVLLVAVSGVLAGGNNGTLKVHSLDLPSPDATPNNEPKVCSFNLEGFGLDEGQGGYLEFTVQGGDAPHGTNPGSTYTMLPADPEGYAISSDNFNDGNGVFLRNGHYKVTLYGKSTPTGVLSDVKAKSKVFKVSCDVGEHD